MSTYRLTWPGIDVRVASMMRVDVTAEGYDVRIDTTAYDGDEQVSHPGSGTSTFRGERAIHGTR